MMDRNPLHRHYATLAAAALLSGFAISTQCFGSTGPSGPQVSVGTSAPGTQSGTMPDGLVGADSTADMTFENTDAVKNVLVGTFPAVTAPFTVMSDSCSNVTLLPWETCTISIKFHPTAEQVFTNNLTIPYTLDPGGTPSARNITYTLSGTGIFPVATVTDNSASTTDKSIAFGNAVLLSNNDKVVTIRNTGTGIVELDSLGQSNTLTAPFSFVNDTCSWAWLYANDTCTVTVRFRPTATGTFNDTFSIDSNDPTNPIITFTVSGIGGVPDVNVVDAIAPTTDLAVPYGNVAIGTTQDQTLTVENTGNATLNMFVVGTGNGLAAPYSIVGDTCSSANVAAAGSCTITVRYAPVTVGTATDSFAIVSLNDPDESTVTVSVSGTGIFPQTINVTDNSGTASDHSVDFGSVTSGSQITRIVTVTNTGDLNLTLGTLGGTAPLAAPFNFFADTCSGTTLTPASACTVSVIFSPVATGTSAGSFDIPSNDPATPSIIFNLTGTAVAPPVPNIEFSEQSSNTGEGFTGGMLDLGTYDVGTNLERRIDIANSGTATLHVTTVTATQKGQGFDFDPNDCQGAAIIPGNSCSVPVSYTALTGASQLILKITTDDPDTPELNLTINAAGRDKPAPGIALETRDGEAVSGLNFGQVKAGDHIVTSLTVRNKGSVDLVVNAVAASNPLLAPFQLSADQCSGKSLPPGAACTIDITLQPFRIGSFSEAFEIASNASNASNAGIAGNASIAGNAGDGPTVVVQVNATVIGSAENQAPSQPGLVSPADGAQITSAAPIAFRWTPAKDPEGAPVTYSLVYCADPTFTGCQEVMALGSRGTPTAPPPTTFAPPAATAPQSAFAPPAATAWSVAMTICVLILVFAARPVAFPRRSFKRLAFASGLLGFVFTFGVACRSKLAVDATGSTTDSSNSRDFGGSDPSQSTAPEKVIPLVAPGIYYWKVIAADAGGAWSESETWKFEVKN